jgi:hypothetical protein
MGRLYGLGFAFQGLRFRVCGSEFLGSGFKVQGLRFRV